MKTPKHTAGPWRIDGSYIYGQPRDEFDNGPLLASVIGQSDIVEEDANAKLIAAAPEMLEFIEHVAHASWADESARDFALEIIRKATA